MDTSSFKEIQRYRQIWVWIIIIGVLALCGWGFYQQIILGKPWGTTPVSDTALILLLLIPIGILILFLTTRLETEINESGIYYQFLPFHFKRYKIDWTTVDKAYVRKYKPVAEYGGWGIRFWFGHGRAYNISGNQGLQLEFKNGRRLLIGTQKPIEIEQLLQQLTDKKIINLSS